MELIKSYNGDVREILDWLEGEYEGDRNRIYSADVIGKLKDKLGDLDSLDWERILYILKNLKTPETVRIARETLVKIGGSFFGGTVFGMLSEGMMKDAPLFINIIFKLLVIPALIILIPSLIGIFTHTRHDDQNDIKLVLSLVLEELVSNP